jgi:hypothetical protein
MRAEPDALYFDSGLFQSFPENIIRFCPARKNWGLIKYIYFISDS